LQKYLPEFDDDEELKKLSAFSKEDLLYMLVRSYKEKRLFAKMLDEQYAKLKQIQAVIDEPSKLIQMPDIPGPDDLRKMME
jgi:hypothetical protein